ncbi:MAG: amidohydrolase family protein, partial [Cyclobacteriaceae bacterium]|nr:amidohydrolase family protein [Cyclobacteriaceae bacterium]
MMKTTTRLTYLFLLLLLPCIINAQNKSVKIIHAGTLLAVPGEKPFEKQSIIIENGAISSVKSGYLTAEELGYDNAEVIDLKDKFVLPGLIDMHTHITGERDPNRNRHEWTTLYDEDAAFQSIPYLNKTLEAGFTTVRNLGADNELIIAIKRAIKKGNVDGPRIIASCGAISATGGHGDSHGYRDEILNAFGT